MTASQTRAVVVRADAPGKLAIAAAPLAPAMHDDVTVRVSAISLNRGEVKRATTASPDGARPGWDFVGVVEEAAASGAGPKVGARVVGLLSTGAWAERLRAPAHAVAVLPDGVSDAEAATLPVAGLTALHALRKGGMLLGRKVLIDGASGGVGHLAVQLAAAAGAEVYGHIRRAELASVIAASCTGGAIVSPTLEGARASGPYDLILDSVGGATLGSAMTMLAKSGACVTFGISEAPTAAFESGAFFRIGGVRLYGLILFDEVMRGESAGEGLSLLARMIERKTLKPLIDVEAPWTEIGDVARRLMDRAFPGKAVLHLKG
jgi:NADPH:quinone reductase-like Zn-dependent oxidoreductase